jgi:hypothetical protein
VSRAQERSSGVDSGAQPAQPAAGNTPGTSGDPTATGSTTPPPGTTTGATSTGLAGQQETGTPAPGAGTQAAGARQARGPGRHSARASDDLGTAGTGAGSTGIGGVLSILTGLLAFLAGLAVVVRTSFYPTLPGYYYHGTAYAWGWTLLILGVLLFAAGATHLLGMAAGRFAAMGFAVLLAVTAFLFLPYTPIWSIILIGLSVFSIWGLARDGEDSARGDRRGYDDRYGQGSMRSDTMSSETSHRM